MNEYITIENLKSWLENWKHTCRYYHPHSNPKTIPFSELEDILGRIEREDVAPVVHAKWIDKGRGYEWHKECSNCSYKNGKPMDNLNYCRNCGAKMDGILSERGVSDERRT